MVARKSRDSFMHFPHQFILRHGEKWIHIRLPSLLALSAPPKQCFTVKRSLLVEQIWNDRLRMNPVRLKIKIQSLNIVVGSRACHQYCSVQLIMVQSSFLLLLIDLYLIYLIIFEKPSQHRYNEFSVVSFIIALRGSTAQH